MANPEEATGTWFEPGKAEAIIAIWIVKEQIEDFSLSVSSSLLSHPLTVTPTFQNQKK